MNIEAKIKKAISKSGYLDEQKVAVEFEKQGFFAGPNFAFEDQDEHISREIDFIATRYTDFTFGKTGFYFFAYGEVKRRANPLIFFERRPLSRETENVEVFIPVVATQEFFPFVHPSLRIKEILEFSKIHHQAKHEYISTQFCEIDVNKAKAEHKDLYEKLFVPLLKCVDSEISDISNLFRGFRPDDPKYFLNLFQPIIVVSGPLYSYNVNDDSLIKKNYILYRRHYKSKTVEITLFIDVVTMEYLPCYISEKLTKTYVTIENALKEKIDQIIGYCIKDRKMENKLIRLMT